MLFRNLCASQYNLNVRMPEILNVLNKDIHVGEVVIAHREFATVPWGCDIVVEGVTYVLPAERGDDLYAPLVGEDAYDGKFTVHVQVIGEYVRLTLDSALFPTSFVNTELQLAEGVVASLVCDEGQLVRGLKIVDGEASEEFACGSKGVWLNYRPSFTGIVFSHPTSAGTVAVYHNSTYNKFEIKKM